MKGACGIDDGDGDEGDVLEEAVAVGDDILRLWLEAVKAR